MKRYVKASDTSKKIIGLKEAVGDYHRANAGGPYDSRYGYLMYDRDTGKIWTDEFFSLGHNEWKEYHDDSVICISRLMSEYGIYDINMKTVRDFIETELDEWDEDWY